MKRVTYKFDDHLIQLSESNNIESAKMEWVEILREQKNTKTGICICQHTIKNIVYMYNINTRYTISVGTGCCKKFKLSVSKMEETILKNKLAMFLEKGEYSIIENLIQYSLEIEKELVEHFIHNIDISNNIDNLEKIKSEISLLINKYKLNYLQDILEKINDKLYIRKKQENDFKINEIKRIEQLQIEKEKEREIEIIEQLRIKKEMKLQIEKEKEREIERIEQLRLKKEMELIEQLKIEKEKFENKKICSCGITKEFICCCLHPKYEIVKLSNNLYCVKCNKWKCRC